VAWTWEDCLKIMSFLVRVAKDGQFLCETEISQFSFLCMQPLMFNVLKQ